jgi:hypothetical protein
VASSKRPTQQKNMLSSTVELIALWASSSSPSLLAFCFSHLIIAVLLLGGRGEWTPGTAEAGTPAGILVRGGKRSGGGQESPSAAASVVEHRHGCAHDVDGRPKGCVAEVDTDAVQAQSSGAEDGPAVGEEEDELMMRAEEFIRRMNRVWMVENVRCC